MRALSLSVAGKDLTVQVDQVLLAGYTGRDRAKVMEHIEELEKLGVAPPPRVPMVYVVGGELLTTGDSVTVQHSETSGEAEFFLVQGREGLLVGVGSDHTDRKEEAIDIQHSKTLCPKVISREVWRYEDLRDHWEQIELRSWMDGRLYQEGTLNAFLPVDQILAEITNAAYQTEGNLIFSGTLPAIGGLAFGTEFKAELKDPVRGRALTIAYRVSIS